MDLFEAIEGRLSVRRFESADIPEEELLKIIDAGRRAPTGKNVQPWEFILVRDKESLAKLDEVQKVFGAAGASAAIGIVADPAASRFWLEDASAAATQMLLAIHGLGYGSVWVEGALQAKEGYAKELLGVPAGKRLAILLPVGRPAADIKRKEKKPLEQVLWRERYGQR